MSLEKKIQEDTVQAMKAKDTTKLNALRMVKTAITNLKIQKKKEDLEDSDVVDVLQKQVKQRKESLESFEKAGRKELAAKEKQEMEILSVYLPEQMDEAAIRKHVQEAIRKTGAAGKADTGRVMKEVMPALKGKADGKLINQVVASLLG